MAKTVELSGFEHVFDTTPRKSALDEAKERIEAKVKAETERRIAFLPWAMRIPEPKFGTLNFEAFPFQRALYSDEVAYAQEVVVQKSSQVGASAWLIRAAIFWPDTRGRTALYVFPHDKELQKFSNQRVAPLIRESEYLASRVPNDNVNNVYQRQIGHGFFNMTGSQSEAGLESVDADLLALDEYDLLVQANVPRAEQRVSGPLSLGLIRRIGFPTLPGYGIAKKYEESDQRRWHVKCEGCNEWQALTFWKNVDQVRMRRVCAKCEKPLDVSKGEWVAAFPDRDIPGFHLSRLIVPNTNVAKIVAASKLRKPFEIQEFHNRTLGEPFVQEEGRLSKEAIAASQSRGNYSMGPMDEAYVSDKLRTMGIDVASVRNLTIRISEHDDDGTKRALWIGEVSSFNDLPRLMDIYGIHMAVIDHLPEGRLARAFAEMYPGRVYIASYATERQEDVLKLDAEQRRVSVRRTEAHDAVIHLVRMQRNLIPLDYPEEYVEHMQAPVRFVERDELDKVVVAYRATGPDDYFQAEVYDVVATEVFWARQLVDDAQREQISTLDDHLEWERSDLGNLEAEVPYHAGPQTQGEYSPGFEDEH